MKFCSGITIKDKLLSGIIEIKVVDFDHITLAPGLHELILRSLPVSRIIVLKQLW